MEPLHSARILLWQCALILKTASILVPKALRNDWYQEWYAEAWHWIHLREHADLLDSRRKVEIIRHCWGALPDAMGCRFSRDQILRSARETSRSASFCLCLTALLVLAVLVFSGFAPAIRSALSLAPYRQPEQLAVFSFNQRAVDFQTSVLWNVTSSWAGKSKVAEAVAAYSWRPEEASPKPALARVAQARVTLNFFDVLGIAAPATGRLFRLEDRRDASGIVLGYALWQSRFHGDPGVAGRRVMLEGANRLVLGVLPASFRFSSQEIGIWQLADPQSLERNLAERTGAVVRLFPGVSMGQAKAEFQKFGEDAAPQFNFASFAFMSIKATERQRIETYLLFTLLALFGSFVVMRGHLLRMRLAKKRKSLVEIFRWWLFFAAKTFLLLAGWFVASTELPPRVTGLLHNSGHFAVEAISAWLFLVGAIVIILGSVRDQCRRCRVCLKRLGQEASVGTASYMLLEWWGTELACFEGHGILHVPESRATWLELDQWTPLDDSWKSLFVPAKQ